jgi:hypothetical protein
MRDLTTKQLIYVGFYYFWNIFLVACIFFDILNEQVNGFTFGYAFALFYFVARTREVMKELENINDNGTQD